MVNRFRVAGFVTAGTFICLLLGMFAFALACGDDLVKNNDLWVVVLLTFGLLGLPFILFAWGFLMGFPKVIVDEKGLHKSLLGVFFKKTILWDDIKHIKVINTFIPWVFFSKSNIDGMGITRSRLRRDNIFVVYSKELVSMVKQYGNKDIIMNTTKRGL